MCDVNNKKFIKVYIDCQNLLKDNKNHNVDLFNLGLRVATPILLLDEVNLMS